MEIMRLLALGLTTLAAVFEAIAAGRQDQSGDLQNLDGFAVMNGTCRRLIVAGKDLSKDCMGKVTNTMYESTGRTGFLFVTRSGNVVVNFTGMDTPAVGDHAASVLDHVIFTQGKTGSKRAEHNGYRATGTCTYTNPYAGPSHINCSASTKKGLFSASFVSDGKPPGIERF
jgi:hypothetical protein